MSSCDCINVDTDYHEGPECFFESKPKAKGFHACCECSEPIKPSEEYIRESGKWDGEFRVYKTCIDCHSIRKEMFCQSWEYTSMWEYVHEYLRDIDYQISEDCLLTLTPRARNMILDIIDEAWRG